MSNPNPPQYPQQPQAPQQPGGYAQPQAPSYTPPSYTAQAPAAKPSLPTTLAQTNTFAVVAVILAFLQPIAGIVFGHMALGQIKRNGDAGRGLALTGVIIGYVCVALILLALIAYVSIFAVMFASIASLSNSYY